MPPRLIYLVPEDWYFVLHRMAMARAARDAGYEVHVATRVNAHGLAINKEGFRLHPLDWHRGSISPSDVIRTIIAVRHLYRMVTPDLVHHIGLQASVLGSLATWDAPLAQINAVVGLGYIFVSNNLKARVLRLLLTPVLPRLLSQPASRVLVENPDDRTFLAAMGVSPERIVVFPGSGVDVEEFRPLAEPGGMVTAAFVGRMIEEKGVRTLLEAHELLRRSGRPVQTVLAGTPDPANPNSISAKEIEVWQTRPGIQWLGYVSDVSTIWEKAHIAILPSRREGFPMSLAEAAACGRPLIATDVPGCREIAIQGVNALLVPPNDPVALADAIDRLVKNPELRRAFGAAGRQIVVEKFSSERVGREMMALYNSIVHITKTSVVSG